MIKSIIIIVSGLVLHLSPIWAVVEFILYLIKDKEFNWWSVYLIPISLVVFILSCLSHVNDTINEEERKTKEFINRILERKNKFKN